MIIIDLLYLLLGLELLIESSYFKEIHNISYLEKLLA